MLKKALSLCLSCAIMLSILQCGIINAFAETEFYNSDGEKINEITNEQSVYAKVDFTAPGNEATVVTARYSSDGALQIAHMEKLTGLTKGQTVEHKSENIGVVGSDTVKVFAIDSLDSLVPLLDKTGEISRNQSINVSASANVTAENNIMTQQASLQSGEVNATVSKGTQLEDGTNTIVLTVKELENTQSGITTKENEIIIPVDVHIDGIAKDNTVPVIITIEDVIMTGMNKGNLTLYHIENGISIPMVQVDSIESLKEHNQFYYDALTGTLTLAMATFSEVTVVADTENAWNGEVEKFAGGAGTETEPYLIANADQLAYLGNVISAGNGTEYYKLTSDINMGGEKVVDENGKLKFYPFGYAENGWNGTFSGTFDGAGHTISNIYQNTWMLKGTYDNGYYNAAMGLFGHISGGTVQNLTVNNFSSDGEFTPTGVIAAYAENSTFKNIAITNCNPRVYNTGNGGIVGIGGNSDDTSDSKLTFTNITIDNTNKISALWGSWDVACGGIMGMFRGNGEVEFANCHVAAQIDVYNDVCGNYQYYWYRYAGMMIGSLRGKNKVENGYTVPDTTGITAEKCTVHFGDWNDYYYCELVANSIASYTHDHQFSRLTEIASLDEIESGETWIKEGNFLLISGDTKTCYHIMKDDEGSLYEHKHNAADSTNPEIYEVVNGETVLKEDKQIVYLPFNQLFQGDGWGVKHIPIYNDGGTYFEGITILDREVADSVDKFESKFTNDFLYRVGNQNTVSLGTLFEKKDSATINDSGVYVTIDKVDENTDVSGTYTANITDWTKGTIKFAGTGVVKVTIQDYDYCTPTVLYLEVVDAVNAITATNATANDVVLLNDCGFSSLEVSGGYTLYGNGFTMTCGSDSTALDMGYAFVILNNGTLDNVQIVCPNFDYAALYKSNLTSSDNRSETDSNGTTRYYNAKSGVMASGNSQILNSRISGGRASLNVSGGNVVVDNSQIELGAVASILVGSANSLTLRDVILIQKPTASTYDANKTLMGFSVLYLCDSEGNATSTAIEGNFVQKAWIDEEDAQYVPSAGEDIVTTVLKETDYLHDLDGDGENESLNLGFAYMPEDATKTVAEPTNITDNRTDKDAIPYEMKDVKVTLAIISTTVYVYSYKNTNGTDDSFKTESEYAPNKYSDNIVVTYSDTADGLTTGKSYGTDGWVYELNVDLDKLSGYALDFSKLSMSVNGIVVNDFKVDGNAKPTSPTSVVAGGTTYTLTATIDGKEYTAAYKVTGTETSKESPSLVASNYEAGLCVASSYGGTWHGAAPALEGIQIKYWSVAEKQYKTITLSDYTPTTAGKQNGTNAEWTYSPDNGDFTLTLTGGQVHSSNNVYAMPVVCDGKLYFVAASSTGLVNTGNSARTIPVSYSFKDNNNGTPLTFSHTWSVVENKDAQYSYSDFCNGTLTKLEDSNCITPETLITLADGTQKEVQYLKEGEELLVWNLKTGNYDTAPIVFNESDAKEEYEIIHLYFADGSDVEVIYEHGFFDVNVGEYIYIRSENAKDYISHEFVTKGDINKNTWKTAKLTNVVIENRVTTPYSPVTFDHLCYYTDGVLSMPGGIEGMFNIFEVDTNTMKYDSEIMSRDIENHGLFTYKDFENIIPEYAYDAFNGQYLKVAIGKGLITWDDIIRLAERYGIYF